MKVSIIIDDKAVYKDNYSFASLDFSAPSNVHALQWTDTFGWIEFRSTGLFSKPGNEDITELPTWANEALTKWQEAKDAELQRSLDMQNQPSTQGSQDL